MIADEEESVIGVGCRPIVPLFSAFARFKSCLSELVLQHQARFRYDSNWLESGNFSVQKSILGAAAN